MAVDRWLLEQHEAGACPPTLRFYSWHPIALSLGYHQRQIPEHWRALTWQGAPVDLVRRPSGGRAVLHQGDLTYALIVSGFTGKRMQVYQHLCEFLLRGWRSLSVHLHYGTAGRGYIHNPNCFGTATGADLLLADGTKLIGSAQLWRNATILQHGSMLLRPDPALFETVFGVPLTVPQLPLPEAWDQRVQTVIEHLVEAATHTFGVDWDIRPLSADEWEAVQANVAEANLAELQKATKPPFQLINKDETG